MESSEQQQEEEHTVTGFYNNETQITSPILKAAETFTNQKRDTKNETIGEDACDDTLSLLYKTLKEPIPEYTSASYISDAAHRLVEGLNAKRKNDVELIEKFKITLDKQKMKYVQTLEQQLYQMYEDHNSQVDKKLQDLFACLDNIAATETELDNFRESLRKLYQEIID